MQAKVIMEHDPRAEDAINRWGELKTERARFEADWNEIARLIRPQRGGFGLDRPDQRDHEKPLSSAPIMAQNNFFSGLYGSLTNPANRWMGLKTESKDLNAWQPMREWLDLATDRVLNSFQPATSPFYSAAIQLFSDVSSFGNAAQYDELDPNGRGILDVTLSLAEVVYDIDAHGRVVEVVRKFTLTPRAAVALFHGRGTLPGRVHELEEKKSTEKLTFYHHVLRNYAFEAGRLGSKGKRWVSRYVCEVEKTLVREAGYDEMPFFAPRWEVESGFVYGTGPGFTALPSARLVQQMEAATIKAAQYAADPTLLARDRGDWPLDGYVRPGAVVYGGLAANGSRVLDVLDTSRGVGLTLQEKQQKIEEIRDAFHFTLMNLAGRTGMTATEVMTINEERMRLWAPHMGRIQEEYLAPKIERRFQMLWRAGQIPPPPQTGEDVGLIVDYQSAAALAQRSTEGAAIVRIIEDISPLAGAMPRLLERLEPDGLLEALMEARGAPARIVRSRDDADAIAAARVQQQQQQQALAAAQQGAGAARDLAGAVGALQGGGGAA